MLLPVKRIWADVLNKPKQDMSNRVFRGELISVHEFHDDKKEHLKTDLALLDNAKETLDNNQPLQELKSKLMEVRSKNHSHHMNVSRKSQIGNRAAKQLASEQSSKRQARERKYG